MAHNPILGVYKIGATDSFVIHEQQVGLLYKNFVFDRKLFPGGGPTLNEKVTAKLKGQEIKVYVVDLKPHNLDFRLSLPAKEYGDLFSTNIRLSYRVVDPERMVDQNIPDSEALITRYLEKELSLISSRLSLHKHLQADAEFTSFINGQADFPGRCGLELVSMADVMIYLSNEQKRRVQELVDIERGLRVQQIYEFKDEVASKDTPHRFEVFVQMTYRVSRTKQDELPSSNLDEVAANLKPRILAALRKVSRRFSITELAEADEGMQEKLDDSLNEFNLFGLEVLSLSVSCDLPETSRKRYLEIVEMKHATELEQLRMAGVNQSAEMISGLVKQGSFAVLAMAVARKEISMSELSRQMDERQKMQFEYQMQVLDKFTSGNLMNEDIIYKQVARVAEAATTNVTGIATEPMPEQLESGKKAALPQKATPPQEDEE